MNDPTEPRQPLAPVIPPAAADEVATEFAFHLEMRTREFMAHGMTPDDARAEAFKRFGDSGSSTAECRAIAGQRNSARSRAEYAGEMLLDIRFAFRQLVKAPAFSIVATLTLALGVGATTAIFSAVHAVVLRPFPFPNAARLVVTAERARGQDITLSASDFAAWRTQSTSFEQMVAINYRNFVIASKDAPERVLGAAVTASIFPALGVQPEIGRVFGDAEDRPGQPPVVVLSDALWRRDFGADSGVVGRTITINGAPYPVIGVMPPAFDALNTHELLWIPIAFTGAQLAQHEGNYLFSLSLLKRGITPQQAQHDLDAIAARLSTDFPRTNEGRGAHVRSMRDFIVGDFGSRLVILLGAVCCVLLIACGNVANLLLARGAARARELTIRAALGAGRARIVRQLLTESAVLAMCAGLLGLLLAWSGVHLLVRVAPATLPRLAETRIDGTVMLFTLVVAALSSVGFGLVPALRGSRSDLQRTLRDGGRAAAGTTRDMVRGSLVAAEVAIALTLLMGAGLLIRSAIYLNKLDPGFDMRGVLSARVTMPPADGADAAATAERMYMAIVATLRANASVVAAGVTSQMPLGPGALISALTPEGRPLGVPSSSLDARLRMVSPGYLGAMRIPLVAGRDIDERDIRGGPLVIVVSAAFANRAWPGENAVGKRVSCCQAAADDPLWRTVIGVAADVRSSGPTQDILSEFYFPLLQAPPDAWTWVGRSMTVVARARNGNAVALTPVIRAAVKSAEPAAPVFAIATLDERMDLALAESRFNLILLTTLGIVGMVLAAAGIYSVIAYFVTLRRQEIGVRMALGATALDILRLTTWQGLRPVIAGAVLGSVGALWATAVLRGSLFGVQHADPLTFVVVTAALIAVALMATIVPALRAARVDPTAAMRPGT